MDRFIIILDRGEIKSIPFYVTQGDNKSQMIPIKLIKDEIAYNLTGKTIRLAVINSKGNGDLIELKNTTPTTGEFDIPLDGLLSSQVGNCNIQIGIFASDGYLLHTSIIRYHVNESLFESISGNLEEDSSFKNVLASFKKLDEWNAYFESTSGKIEEKYTTRLNGMDASLADMEQQKANQIDLVVERGRITEVANKGTTVEVLERVTKEEIDRKIVDGTIANLTIADNSVTNDKVKNLNINKLETMHKVNGSLNLLRNKLISDKKIDTLGKIVSSTTTCITEFIPVESGQIIKRKFITNVDFTDLILYDKDKKFIKKLNAITNAPILGYFYITIESNVAFIIIEIGNNKLVNEVVSLNGNINKIHFEDVDIKFNYFNDIALKPAKESSVCDFNILEKAIWEKGVLLSSTGLEVANATAMSTDFISVLPSTTGKEIIYNYSHEYYTDICFYDSTQKFLAYKNINNVGSANIDRVNKTIKTTIPANTSYVRIVSMLDIITSCIIKQATFLEEEHFKFGKSYSMYDTESNNNRLNFLEDNFSTLGILELEPEEIKNGFMWIEKKVGWRDMK